MFLEYYWENMKSDMSKILLSDLKDPEEAKLVSLKVFAIDSSLKFKFVKAFAEYTKCMYNIKFFKWR
jgi:hypothetical protein